MLAQGHQPDSRSADVQTRSRPLGLDFLFLVFGVSAWAAINGLWVESPLLVRHLPEAWNLASYIVILTQIANIGPVGYTFLRHYFKSGVIIIGS